MLERPLIFEGLATMRRILLGSAFFGVLAISVGACSSTNTGGQFVPDGGAGTGGGVGGGPSGGVCETLCAKLSGSGCPSAKGQASCQADCTNPPLVTGDCKPLWDTYVTCGATQGGVTCSTDGLPLVTGCEGQLQAFTSCQNAGTGGVGGDGGAPGGGGAAGGAAAPGGGGISGDGGGPSGGGGVPSGGGAPGGGGGPSGGGGGPTGGGGAPQGGGGGPSGGGGGPSGGGGGPSGGGGSPGTLPPGCWTGATPECNPLNNSGCTGTGEACDLGSSSGASGIFCFGPPNTTPLNGSCSNSAGPYCQPTLHCSGSPGNCKKFCCSSSDCGGGTCTALGTSGTLGYCN